MTKDGIVTVREMDTAGLTSLLRALQSPCACESAEHEEECREAPLDRWWRRAILGQQDEADVVA